MRRVLLVSEARRVGGAEIYLERLARGLTRFRPEFVLPRSPGLSGWGERLRGSGWAVWTYGPGPAGLPGLLRAVRESGPDLVHVNLPSTYDGGAGFLPWALGAAARAPVVVTEHLTRLPRSRRRRLVKLATARGVAVTVVVSRSSRDTLVAEGLAPERIVVVANGVPDPGPPPPPEDLQGPLRLGVLGSLEPRKQVEVPVQVLARLADAPLRLEVAGEGELRPALERLADRLGQKERVRFLGRITDAASFLARQHLLLLPSRLEGMPLAVLEAFAAGRGALVSDLPGMDEVVDDEVGRRLPPSDVSAWSEAVLGAVLDRGRVEAWGRAARRRYADRFTLERVVAETEAVYDRVLEGRPEH